MTGTAIHKAVLAAPSKASAATGISQDNIIFAMLLLAFVVYVTLNNELSTYLAFFTPGKQLGPAPVLVTPGQDPSGGTPIGTALGIPGLTTLSPGASGIVQGTGGTQLLNPGQPFNFGGMFSGIGSWLKSFGSSATTPSTPYTGG